MMHRRTQIEVERLPVFVYGTLRTGQSNWGRYLRGRTISERPATAPNHCMYSTGLAFVLDGEGTVAGDLMEIEPSAYQQVMADLDALEGVQDRATGEGVMYSRVKRPVIVEGTTVEAWIYHASSERRFPAHRLVPDGDWLNWRRRQPGLWGA